MAESNTGNAASAPAPVAGASRFESIDIVRGVAVLGILLLNIPFFAMPERFSEPWRADTTNANFWVHAINTVLFEGKMRALFSAVFGAGIVLFTEGKEKAGRSPTSLFFKRMTWLVIFGILHAHAILWVGDILYFYGLIGMLAFVFRKLNPKWLAAGVPLVAIMGFVGGTIFYQGMRAKRLDWREAMTAQQQGRTLTPPQDSALVAWREVEKEFIPNQKEIAEHTALMKGSYSEVGSFVRKRAFDGQVKYLLFSIPDMLALMLLGIALYRWGFLTLGWSNAAYARTALIGYGVGLSSVIFTYAHGVIVTPTLAAALANMEATPIQWTGALYDVQRIAIMMAHVSVLMLLLRAGRMAGLFARLRAAGQMAFTNYVMQSVICTLVFYGYGFNQFAEWHYYQLFFLVIGIWVLQLIVSPWWLERYQFGPLEWVWRTLTYGRRQPFVRQPAVAPVPISAPAT